MHAPLSTDASLSRADRRGCWIPVALSALAALLVVAGFLALWWVSTLPERVDEQQTILVGQTRLSPDSDASVRVVVQDLSAGRPIADAQVKVSLKPETGRAIPLFQGRTDETGSLPVRFHVPADAPPKAQLVIETRSKAGRDRVEQPVTVQREYRLLLTSDKPLYQPGQTIHMRALALSTLDLAPARGATVDFMVQDPKGNKVYRQSVAASDYGIAAADFGLADLVNQGNYKLSVSIGDTTSEKTVEVRPYVLPKFGVNVSTDRTFYLPGERVEGTVQADYFFGKPVAQGQVQVVGSVWDVARTVVVDLYGQTDENGAYQFAFDLPEYFAGSGLESGQAQFALEVTVIDQADHAEQTSQVLPIAAQPLIIEAVAESGILKPGIENVVYLLTAYPDGRPARTQLQVIVDGVQPVELSTGQSGLAEFTFVPRAGAYHTLDVFAQDETGLAAQRRVGFETEYTGDSVLLRADRAAYVVGETMHLVALTPVQSGSVYLDIVKAGQTLSTRSAPVQDGKAEFAVDVTPDLYGTLELHAYKVLLDGTIVRDTRLVVVDAPNDVDIAIAADKDTYLPGEMATVDFHTADAQNSTPVQTALGIAIVDESVFALQRQDPGFAKLYFLLEQELLEPFYQVKGFVLPASVPPQEEQIRRAQDSAAKATWAGAPVAASARPVNSRPEKLTRVYEAQDKGFRSIGWASAVGLVAVPISLWGIVLAALWRARVVKRSLVRLIACLGALALIVACLVGWFIALSDSFRYIDEEVILVPGVLLAAVGILGVLALGGYALARQDPAAGLLSVLTLAWGTAFFVLVRALEQVSSPPGGLILVGPLSWLPIPAAYILLGQGRWVQARRVFGVLSTGLGAALASVPILLLLLVGPVVGNVFDDIVSAAPPGVQFMAMEGGEVRVEVEREVEKAEEVSADSDQAQAGEAPRLRQYFRDPDGRQHHHLAADGAGLLPGRQAGLYHARHTRLSGLFRGHRPARRPDPGRRDQHSRRRFQLPAPGTAGTAGRRTGALV
jgi:5-hydroxyisourate hydrolase-like protein (transthyretin family)